MTSTSLSRAARGLAALEVVPDSGAGSALLGALLVLAMSLGAYVSFEIPLTEVPVTLQSFFWILAGALLGARAGALTVAAYVILGASGVPVFAGGRGGFVWLLGASGGYLLAAPAAAYVVGVLAGGRAGGSRASGFPRLVAAFSAGTLVVYAGGLSWLWIITRQDLPTLLTLGVFPFLIGDLLKVLVAVAIVGGSRSRRFGPVEGGALEIG